MNDRTKNGIKVSVATMLAIFAIIAPPVGYVLVNGMPWHSDDYVTEQEAQELIRNHVDHAAALLKSDVDHIKEKTDATSKAIEEIKRQNIQMQVTIGRIEEKIE